MHEKVNYELGRMLYDCMVDAAGYPNGMPFWEEMKADDKYYYCLLAIDFLEKEKKSGLSNKPYGIGRNPNYGEGECKALMDHINEVAPEELMAFEKRLEMMQSAYAKRKEEQDNVVDTQSAHSPDAE